jgi:tetratricopeptide (TPR) repeat protein
MTQDKLLIAFDLHKSGRCDEAISMYQEILATDPHNFDVLHLLGLAAYQDGQLAAAEAFFVQALSIKSDFWQIYASYGRTLHDLARLEDALTSYDMAISLNPEDAEVYCERGLVLKDLGRPHHALKSLNAAIALRPTFSAAFNNSGSVLKDLNLLEEAVASYDAAILLEDDYARAYSNRGVALRELGRHDEALESLEWAISIQPNFADAYFNRANALKKMDRFAESLRDFDASLLLNPDNPEGFCNRGNALQDLSLFEDAIASYDQAVAINPCYAEAYSNRGEALKALNRLDQALVNYDQAISLKADYAEPLWNKALVTLLKGDFETGWTYYEWRKKIREPYGDRTFAKPFWDGQASLAGKTILVHWEQGLGDTIQFCRYIECFNQLGAGVLFAPQKKLGALMMGLNAPFELVDANDLGLKFDFHIPLLSAPYAFRTDYATIPGRRPYLKVEPDLIEFWWNKIGAEGLKIGICWQGSTGRIDAGRSFSVTEFHRLAGIPGVRLISLHRGEGESQLIDLPVGMNVESLEPDYDAGPHAFVDAAAAIACCDLVITSDTAIAHLAGALGVPTWVALKCFPDWRWLLNRSDSPWYPSMRLFRQPAPGDWNSVFVEMEQALRTEFAEQLSNH